MSRSLIDANETLPANIAGNLPGLVGTVAALLARSNELCGAMDAAESSLNTSSLKSFGAVGDGVNDDRPAIQAAIQAVAGSGGEVYFPAGTYRVTQSGNNAYCLNLPAGVRLRGAFGAVIQKDATLAGTSGKSVPILNVQGNGAAVVGLKFDGNRQSVGWDANFEHQAGIFVQSSDAVVLANLEITGCGGDAIQLYNSTTNPLVAECYLHGNNRQGVSMTPSSSGTPVSGVRIVANRIYDNQIHAIDGEPSGSGTVTDVMILCNHLDIGTSTQYAVATASCSSWTIAGNKIRGTVNPVNSSSITITANTIDDVLGGGTVFVYQKSAGITVTGNVLRSIHAVASAGNIRVDSTSGNLPSGLVFANNDIDCTAAPADCIGIFAKTATDITIVGNTLIGAGLSSANGKGMHLRASIVGQPMRLLNVVGNTVRNFGSTGINIAGGSTAQITFANIADNVLDDTAGTMTTGISLDDGNHPLQAFSVCNNTGLGGVSTVVANIPAGSTTAVAAAGTNSGWLIK